MYVPIDFVLSTTKGQNARRMYQAALFGEPQLSGIVNVAAVPQRSPFRYPGGKTWLVPRVRRWLAGKEDKPVESIEPFAGGGIISLTIAFEQLAERVLMVELDDDVASVWETILQGDGVMLAEEIATFELTDRAVVETLAHNPKSVGERAFRTILKNRVQRGGILAPGAGLVKQGENGKGLASRWYPETLKRRILNIIAVRDRICFMKADGMEVLRQYSTKNDVVFFIDPPYTAAGKKAGSRLYTHSNLNHNELFRVASSLSGDFLMTYDNTLEVQELADWYGLDTLPVAMKNTHHARMTELLIGRDLDWAR
jgi:DNA adenine methylase